MSVEPVDKPKFDQMIADMTYFYAKYGSEIGQAIFAAIIAPHLDRCADMDDRDKSYIFASGVNGLQEAAKVMHDQLFPFGHAGQSLDIEEKTS